ncbi:DUF5681 domain-containing protein [uncultured Shimia sp.]|uniref:DUF5681 domain-containing protein n=1 Tax=uncultured Shimia sp. TaxID=573152 RepID=UPI0026263005|nr:DUF5681 domain-containing protein [uncultured Shimia sp.]
MRFKKGQSGNPHGRPAMPKEVRDAIQANGEIAVRRMSDLLNDDAAWGADGWLKPVVQIKLLAIAHERAFGRAGAVSLNQQIVVAKPRSDVGGRTSRQVRQFAALIPKQ